MTPNPKCPVCNSSKLHINKGTRARWTCEKCGSSGEKSPDLGMVVFERADLDHSSIGNWRTLRKGR